MASFCINFIISGNPTRWSLDLVPALLSSVQRCAAHICLREYLLLFSCSFTLWIKIFWSTLSWFSYRPGDRDLISLFCRWGSKICQHLLSKRPFSTAWFLALLPKIRFPPSLLTYRSSVLLHRFNGEFSYQAVFVILSPLYNWSYTSSHVDSFGYLWFFAIFFSVVQYELWLFNSESVKWH